MHQYGNLKAVIWDLDGVIVDSEPLHFQSWHTTLEKYNSKVTDDQLRKLFGMTSPEVVKILFGKDIEEGFVKKICDEKEQIFRAAIIQSAAYLPGVEHWLSNFMKTGLPQALASSGSQENIDAILDALGTRPFLNVIVSGKDMPSKPDPAVFLLTAQKLCIHPSNCLVIEDSIAGVKAAKSAGMKCLAVMTTNHSSELAPADLILENLDYLTQSALKLLFPS